MTAVYACLIVVLLMVYGLASYADRVYSDMGKFLSRESEETVAVWERRIEPLLGMSRARAALSAALLAQLSLGFLALVFGAMMLDRAAAWGRPTLPEIVQAILSVALTVVLVGRLLPVVLFTRTRGEWMARWVWPLRMLFLFISPVTLACSFLLSIVALGEAPPAKRTREEQTSEAVDALIEAGEEEGILEESDRELVRSAVEFGDKVVRELMTPRPSIFAVEAGTTLEELLGMLEERAYSRIPVYAGTLDNVTGILFSHDLLQVSDREAGSRTAASLERPAAFVPETKRVNELLREMQREKQHMRIVIDEYGGVSGLVTIEDLLEEIVGEITDEHEDELDVPVEEAAGVWVVPGALELGEMERLSPEFRRAENGFEATTIGGLVSEVAGRIPMAGEVVVYGHLRFEILASTDRRIERLRVSPMQANQAEPGANSAA